METPGLETSSSTFPTGGEASNTWLEEYVTFPFPSSSSSSRKAPDQPTNKSTKQGAGWGNMMTMSLRNELRSPDNNPPILATYNWETWYANVVPAMDLINGANPDVIIFMSGLGFDTTMAPITTATDLGSGTTFLKTDFTYANKLVVEIHNYDNDETVCGNLEGALYVDGYNGLNSSDPEVVNVFPVIMTEWGHGQDAADYAGVYQTCLASFLGGLNAGWMVWVLAGSYYIREGTQDYDETWGMFWSSFPLIFCP